MIWVAAYLGIGVLVALVVVLSLAPPGCGEWWRDPEFWESVALLVLLWPLVVLLSGY